jgi:hypothetical protein
VKAHITTRFYWDRAFLDFLAVNLIAFAVIFRQKSAPSVSSHEAKE